jgi:hypothetical protein
LLDLAARQNARKPTSPEVINICAPPIFGAYLFRMHASSGDHEYFAGSVRRRIGVLDDGEGAGQHETTNCVGKAMPFVGWPRSHRLRLDFRVTV